MGLSSWGGLLRLGGFGGVYWWVMVGLGVLGCRRMIGLVWNRFLCGG